jgi:hypothetical protein
LHPRRSPCGWRGQRIAHSVQPTASLAVWPALSALAALFTQPTSDWESVAAGALRQDPLDPGPRRLTAWLAAGFVALFAAVVATGLDEVYLRDLIAVPDDPADLGLRWAALLLPTPALWLLRGYLRAMVMADGSTGWLVRAAAVHLATLAAAAAVLLRTGLPGVAVAALAITGGLLADITVTRRGTSSAQPGEADRDAAA